MVLVDGADPSSWENKNAVLSELPWNVARKLRNVCKGHTGTFDVEHVQPCVKRTPRPAGSVLDLETSKHKAGDPAI